MPLTHRCYRLFNCCRTALTDTDERRETTWAYDGQGRAISNSTSATAGFASASATAKSAPTATCAEPRYRRTWS